MIAPTAATSVDEVPVPLKRITGRVLSVTSATDCGFCGCWFALEKSEMPPHPASINNIVKSAAPMQAQRKALLVGAKNKRTRPPHKVPAPSPVKGDAHTPVINFVGLKAPWNAFVCA